MEINGIKLDSEQLEAVHDESNYLLVVAGAGSGKTLTILGKISYLLNIKKINPEEIICISFTNEATISLKEKLRKSDLNIKTYTFHKLALEILKNKYQIADPKTLENIINNFFKIDILYNEKMMNIILNYFNLKTKKEYLEFYEKSYENILELEKLINTFIKLFKCNNYHLEDYNKFLKKSRNILNIKNYKKEKYLLILCLNIYIEYETYLKENNEIDFDDMLIKATQEVKETYKCKIKYIIIDEYQDTSFVRFNLIKSIIEKTNSKLMVVGDDFQSIYRFTGCDIELFTNFNKYFKNAKVMKISNTYRNSDELVKIAGNFIMKNKDQIKKDLKSKKHINKPIVIVKYKSKNELKNLIIKIYQKNKKILILGRNNNDIKDYLDKDFIINQNQIIYLKNKNIDINYLTIHKSKGLEADNVIIINLYNKTLGFPNKMKNDKLLRFVTKTKINYPYDEERRLFYVALTRTKEKVYLFTPINSSIFVNELIDDYKNEIEII